MFRIIAPLALCTVALPAALLAQENRLTHGPMLGRPTSDSVAVWVRTAQPGKFRVRYGIDPERLDALSPIGTTRLEHDNTGWVLLDGLQPNTRYHYRAQLEPAGTLDSAVSPGGSFLTLPRGEDFYDAETNPRGLFNFSFEFGCCNHQRTRGRRKADVPIFDTMLRTHGQSLHFAIQNGDWCYEEERDFPLDQWLAQVGRSASQAPDIVRRVPLLVGAWENYKLYLDRSDSLVRWHAHVPSLFVFDDHEILDDAAGAGTIGARPRRALYRDIGVRAWYDYLGWANPIENGREIDFGLAQFQAGSNVLTDPEADFRGLTVGQRAELHVHWGGPDATKIQKEFDFDGGNPNAGVYEVVRVLDPHRLEIRPPARATATSSYSIGRFSYFKQTVANCDFLYLDTRSHRDLPEDNHPLKPGISLLGARQKAWLKQELAESQADCFFLISTVNFMIPHVVDVGEDRFTNYIDSWPAFLEEREELIDCFEQLDRPVFILTGDLHNSFVIQITDKVWEFASAPHNSSNASFRSEGSRPPNGVFDSYGRECFIRWSTWFGSRMAARTAPRKVYCVVNVNNIFPQPDEEGQPRWQAFPHPQVVFQYHDGYTGELLYAESVVVGPTWRPPATDD